MTAAMLPRAPGALPAADGGRVPSGTPPEFTLAGGVVAHNEEGHIERALRSLLDQELPEGVAWSRVRVVASGCTDGTVEEALSVARTDPRVAVRVETERSGKAAALGEIFRTAEGDALVLLNSDAIALPGSVRELLRVGRTQVPPYAVMARPVPSSGQRGRWASMFRQMWDLHHAYHLELQREGGGAHLSDELILVSLRPHPPLPRGIVNDGSYLGVWLAQHERPRSYAPDARVAIEVPVRLRDHLHQRRRIHFGNAQVSRVLGRPPSTLVRSLFERPRTTLALLRRSVGEHDRGLWGLAALGAAEIVAKSLGTWDRVPPPKDHVRWRRIAPGSTKPGASALPPYSEATPERLDALLGGRIAALVGTAGRFGTAVSLEEALSHLPRDGPRTPEELAEWLSRRPELGRVEGGRLVAPHLEISGDGSRAARGRAYVEAARRLIEGPIAPALSWLRCIGVTGSTAYGEPEDGDDVDYFVVARTGTLWLFLTFTYLALQRERLRRGGSLSPEPCFNFVLDDSRAVDEFAIPHGFLFAREALGTIVLRGEEYYRSLLRSAPWIGQEIPRRFRERSGAGGPPSVAVVRWPLRAANSLLFPLVASYLQFAGIVRNRRLAEAGRHEAVFRTRTELHAVTFSSHRFELLRAANEAPRAWADAGGPGASPRIVTAR